MDVVEEQWVCKLLVHLVILGRKAEEEGGLKDRFVVGDEQQIPLHQVVCGGGRCGKSNHTADSEAVWPAPHIDHESTCGDQK